MHVCDQAGSCRNTVLLIPELQLADGGIVVVGAEAVLAPYG